jgi:hypothetical protein
MWHGILHRRSKKWPMLFIRYFWAPKSKRINGHAQPTLILCSRKYKSISCHYNLLFIQIVVYGCIKQRFLWMCFIELLFQSSAVFDSSDGYYHFSRRATGFNLRFNAFIDAYEQTYKRLVVCSFNCEWRSIYIKMNVRFIFKLLFVQYAKYELIMARSRTFVWMSARFRFETIERISIKSRIWGL